MVALLVTLLYKLVRFLAYHILFFFYLCYLYTITLQTINKLAVTKKLVSSSLQKVIIYNKTTKLIFLYRDVAELVNALDLGPSRIIYRGSSPLISMAIKLSKNYLESCIMGPTPLF